MRIRYALVLLAVMTATLFTSCRSTASLAYVTNADSISVSQQAIDYALRLAPADELIITVNSLVPQAATPFNLAPQQSLAATEKSTTLNTQFYTYVVDDNGFIDFPVLGKIQVKGLTTTQLKEQLTARIAKEIEDPVVRVQLANFRVNVLGEVHAPGRFSMQTERCTVFDALAAAGDMNEYGRRDNVLLIREENGQRAYHRLNLTDGAIVDSPYFYLQQNDVIYVEPTAVKASNAKYSQNNGYKLSVISTCVSAISVIASLVIAVCIK